MTKEQKEQKTKVLGAFVAFIISLIPFIGIVQDIWPLVLIGDVAIFALISMILNAGDETNSGFIPLLIIFSGILVQIAWAIMA